MFDVASLRHLDITSMFLLFSAALSPCLLYFLVLGTERAVDSQINDLGLLTHSVFLRCLCASHNCTRMRHTALIFLDCLFSCCAVIHLHFSIFVAAADTKSKSHFL